MKKTSVYLTEREAEILRRIAEDEGKSQAMVLREALAAYDADRTLDSDFAVIGSGLGGDGTSIADISEDELMRGFGEDDIAPYLRHRSS